VQLALRVQPLTRDDVMTAGEVADLIRMPLSTVYELARRGVIRPTGSAAAGASSAARSRSGCSPVEPPGEGERYSAALLR
jgi:hypothetical protein